jgi:hypothetical protein
MGNLNMTVIETKDIDERVAELEKFIEDRFVDPETDTIDLYDLNATLTRELDKSETKGPYTGGGFMAGWRDSNKLIRPQDLVGRIWSPGLLTEMRYSDDVIAPLMDSIEASICSLEYDVVPRAENPTEGQVMAAQGVKHVLNNMPFLSMEKFISSAWNNVASYGFALFEVHVPVEGPRAFKLQLHSIAPWQVESFDLNEDRTRLVSVRVDNGDGIVTIDAAKLVWFGDEQFISNYWGTPMTRPAMAAFSAKKEDIKNYLSLRRLQKGIIVCQENTNGSTTASWQAVKNWLRRFYMGQNLPLLLNAGMELQFIQATQPGIDTYDGMLRFWDEKIRASLDDSLGNLGTNGVGSLALGQEVADVNKSRMVAKTNKFLEFVNGNTNIDSQLLQLITELIGFSPATETPKIIAIDNTEADMTESATIFAGWLKDNVITRDEAGDANIKRMIEAIGFDTSHLEDEEVETIRRIIDDSEVPE